MPDTRDGGLLDRIIMVVDGDDEAREGLSNFLRSCGYLAFGETTVWRALAYLDMGLRPCAIVLDVPEPDAMEFRSAQVRDPRVRGIPVIVGARLGEKPTLSEAETGTPTAQATADLLSLLADYCSRRGAPSSAHLRVAPQRGGPA